MKRMQISTALMLALAIQLACQAQTIVKESRPTQYYRTIITYSGQVCLATERYDITGGGGVVFKQEEGVRFGNGYFWSPAVRDQTVRQGHYTSRVVGTPTKFWPPVAAPTVRATRRTRTAGPTSKHPHFSGRIQVAPKPVQTSTTPTWSSGVLDQAKAYRSAPNRRASKPISSATSRRRRTTTNACPPPQVQTECLVTAR